MTYFPIVVIAYNRPKYLYITLWSLFNAIGIENHKVYLYVDGGGDKLKEVLAVVDKFPIYKTVVRDHKLEILMNVTNSIHETFEASKSDELFYIEDDFILRADILEYLYGANRDAFFTSPAGGGGVSGGKGNKAVSYRPRGNLVLRKNFYTLYGFIMNHSYAGMYTRRGTHDIVEDNSKSHDMVYDTFMYHNGLLTHYSPVNHVLHFGIEGRHFWAKGKQVDYIDKFFEGDESCWIGNILRIKDEDKDENVLQNLWRCEFKWV